MGRFITGVGLTVANMLFGFIKSPINARRNGNDRRTFDCAFYQFDHTEAEKKRDRRRFYLL